MDVLLIGHKPLSTGFSGEHISSSFYFVLYFYSVFNAGHLLLIQHFSISTLASESFFPSISLWSKVKKKKLYEIALFVQNCKRQNEIRVIKIKGTETDMS